MRIVNLELEFYRRSSHDLGMNVSIIPGKWFQ